MKGEGESVLWQNLYRFGESLNTFLSFLLFIFCYVVGQMFNKSISFIFCTFFAEIVPYSELETK